MVVWTRARRSQDLSSPASRLRFLLPSGVISHPRELDAHMSDPVVIKAGPGSGLRLLPLLEPGESAQALYFSANCKVGGWDHGDVNVLLTDRRIIFAKERLFGGPKIDRSLRLGEITKTVSGAMFGVGPAWLLHLTDSQSWINVIQFSQGDECAAFVRALSQQY